MSKVYGDKFIHWYYFLVSEFIFVSLEVCRFNNARKWQLSEKAKDRQKNNFNKLRDFVIYNS